MACSEKQRKHLVKARACRKCFTTRKHKHLGSKRGAPSKTHPGDKDYTTKKGDKDFHRKRKLVVRKRKPYQKKK